MTSTTLSQKQLNFARISIVCVDINKLPLRDILTIFIKPADLDQKITNCTPLKTGKYKLNPDQKRRCCYNSFNSPDYSKFDITLLYKLIRNLCPSLEPTKKWGNKPASNDLDVGDDIERIKDLRNTYFAHSELAEISDDKFKELWSDAKCIIQRCQHFTTSNGCKTDYSKMLIDLDRKTFTFDEYTSMKERSGAIYVYGDSDVLCGETARFEAEITLEQDGYMPVSWDRVDGLVRKQINIEDKKYRGSDTRKLIINNVCKDDEAGYQVVISRNHDVKILSNKVYLRPKGELPCLEELNATTKKGEIYIHYVFKVSENSPTVNGIKWKKDKSMLELPSDKYRGGGLADNCVTILRPGEDDKGLYTCTVSNAVGSVSKSVKLDIPSAEIRSTTNLKVMFGSDTRFGCSVSGYPSANKVKWQNSLDGTTFYPIDIDKEKYFGSSSDPCSPFLLVLNATLNDQQYYRVIVSNEIGKYTSKKHFLQVTGSKPNMPEVTCTFQSHSLKLKCQVFLYDESPALNDVYWTKNGMKIDIEKTNGKYSEMDINDPSLTINRVNHNDAGDYQLTAVNAVGEKESEVIVLGVPQVNLEKCVKKEDGSLLFTMTIKSVPVPHAVQWIMKEHGAESFQPINVNVAEYKGTSNTFPHPVLVIKHPERLENCIFEIEVKNQIGEVKTRIPGEINQEIVKRKQNTLGSLENTLYKDKGAGLKFAILNNDLTNQFPVEKLKLLKFIIQSSGKVADVTSLKSADSAMECFTILQDENIFSKRDVIFMQFLCKETRCKELYEKCTDYALSQNALCYFERQIENGYTKVEFHVQGDLNNYTKEDILNIVETVAGILNCRTDEILVNGVHHSRSFMLVLSLKDIYTSKLMTLSEQDCSHLTRLCIDYFILNQKIFQLDSSKDLVESKITVLDEERQFAKLCGDLANDFPWQKFQQLRSILSASKKTRNMESLMAANSVLECFTILLDENLFSKADVSFIQFLCKETNCEELHIKCAEYARGQEIHFFKKGSSSTLSSTFRRRPSGQFRSPALSRCSSGCIFSSATNAFNNSDSDFPDDTDAESKTDFEHREPLEIELSENSREYFEELDGEFSSTRYEQSCLLYSNDDNSEYSRTLQDDITQYGLELSNEDYFQDKQEKEPFYEKMIPKERLEETLKSEPHRYKRCKFTVQNAHESTCKVLDIPDVDGLEEIQISGRSKAGRTFDGDIVLVEVYNYEKYTKQFIGRYKRDINRNNKLHKVYGKVVGVFERNRTEAIKRPVFVCVLDDTSNFLMRPVCRAVPKLNIIHDFKSPNFILVHKYDPQSMRLNFHDRFQIDPRVIKSFTFQVVLIRWTDFYPYPLAAVINVIKIEETPSSALQNLRLQHHVPKFYRKDTVIETERKVLKFSLDKVKHEKDRENLTGLKVFTIDPSGSQDLDDALSIETSDENYQIGVHIADVGAAIHKNDAIDLEAQERTCTFYPGQGIKPYHMLPEPYSTDICSLIPDVPRPALTVLITLGKNKFDFKKFEVKKTTVKSVQQFTYEEIQKIIDGNCSTGELDERILLLFKIAKIIRRERIGDAMFAFPVETKLNDTQNSVLNTKEAHYLVEEFMILANRCIAQYLWGVFPDVLPVRCQEAPSEEMVNKWIEQNNPIVNMVLKLQEVKPKHEFRIGLHQIQNPIRYIHVMPFQKWVWESLLECTRKNDMKAATRIIGTDELHPLQCLALEEWTSFQETAVYKCTGTCKNENKVHFSLRMNLYVHFTSPIRRYPDLIINRLIHAALEKRKCPYLPEEVHELCRRFNSTMRSAEKFHKQCQLMSWGFQLKKTPQIVHGFVKEFTEKSVSIIIPGLQRLPLYCRDIPLNRLHLSEKPTVSRKQEEKDDLVILKWSQRLYDVTAKPVTKAGWLGRDAKAAICKQINPHTKAKFVMQETWKTILKMIVEENISELRKIFTERHVEDNFGLDEDKHNFVETCKNTVLDHSSEVESGNVIKQGCEYSMSFSRGQIVTVQLSAEPMKGILSPSMQLFDMTRSIKHCLQHTRDPIKFLSDYSILKPLKIYYTTMKYLSIWLPLHEMEAVTSAVDDDSCTINNVSVEFTDKRHGHFYLTRRFCDQRDIDFSRMTEDFIIFGEDDSDQQVIFNNNFVCLKSEHVYKKPSKARENVPLDPDDRLNWILHGQITDIEKIKPLPKDETLEQTPRQRQSTKNRFKVKFKLHEASCDPSDGMLYEENPSTCSVEIISKSETDVRIEAVLKCLGQSTDLAKKIALNGGKSNQLNSWYSGIAKRMNVEVNLPNIVSNNEYQKNAIKKALTSTFTLIHGPPGTGKTYTGTKLVYLFDKINSKMQEEGHAKMQLVFCGPNNKSVDLVASLTVDVFI